MPSPGGVEFGGILRPILDRINGAGWWPCGARLGDVGGQPEVSQDSLDHRRLVNQRHEAQPPPIAVAGSNDESGVQIEPVRARVTGPQRGRRDGL